MQSLNIPSLLRNPNQYTAAEIEAALRGSTGSRQFSFRYELLDETNKKLRDLDQVRSAKISQNWLADIKRTASFMLRSGNNTTVDPIDYLKHRIKPWVRLHMPAKAIPDPDPVLPPDPPTPPAFAALTDDFETAEKSSVWNFYANGVNNVGGKLRIPAKPDYPGAESNASWSLTGSHVAAEVNTVPSATGGTDVATSIIILSANSGTNLTFQYRLTGFGVENKLEFLNFDNNFSDPSSTDTPYDPLEHRWWRMRESGPAGALGNYLGNGNFETDVTGWSSSGTPTFVQSAVRAWQGTKSMEVTWGNVADQSVTSVAFSGLTIGVSYVFKARVYVVAGESAVNLAVAGITNGASNTVFDGWQELSVTWTATATSHQVRIKPTTTPPVAGHKVWMDAGVVYESSRSVVWETSRTGLPGTWQTQRTVQTPGWVISEAGTLRLFVQSNRIGGGEEDFAEIDNVGLTPEGTETAFMPQTEWFNNFNGTPGVTGEAVTANNSLRTGDPLDDVLGTAIYDQTYSADNNKSVKLGDDSGTSGGTLVVRLRSALPQWSMRFWYRMAAGGVLTVRPDGALANTSNDIVIDDNTDTVTLGTVSVPTVLKPNFVGQLVKVEVITTTLLTIYRVFWTDPQGDSPDYVTSESNVGRDPLLTVTIAGGGSTTPPVWFDNLLITEPRFFAPFTDDSVNWVEWPQGVFLLSSPTRQTDTASVVTRDIQGYDLAQVLQDDQVPDRFSTANLLRVDDNFTRDVTGSFGTSDDGTVWLHNTVANTAIGVNSASPGFAFIELQANPATIRLAQAGNTNQEILVDSEIYARIAVDQVATGAALISGAIFRLFTSNDYYRVRFTFETGGTIQIQVTSTNSGTVTQHGDNIATGITYTAGVYVNIRAQCIGHVMRAKVWKSGTLEPAGWMIEEEVPTGFRITHGYTGVSGSGFSGNTNVNPEHRWDTFQLNPNPNNTYTGVVEHLLIESNLPRKITASSAAIPVPKEWEAGTNKLTIINELLAAVNYESLAFDEDGFAVAKPYVSPQNRPAEIDYRDDELSVMYPDMTQELDLFSIPNRWILTVSDPDRENITVTITNNDPASPTSTVRRGRTITSFEQGQDADSEATMIAKAARVAFEASQVFEAIDFSTGIMPIHSGNDVYTLGFDPLNLNAQYSEVQWDMDLSAGSKMTHRARRVISFTADQDPSIIGEDVIVTGALEAGNIAVGVTQLTPVANKPTKVVVSGLNLQGTGPVRVIATAETSVPGSTFREVTTADHTAFGFSIWGYRTNTTTTGIHWMALRGA